MFKRLPCLLAGCADTKHGHCLSVVAGHQSQSRCPGERKSAFPATTVYNNNFHFLPICGGTITTNQPSPCAFVQAPAKLPPLVACKDSCVVFSVQVWHDRAACMVSSLAAQGWQIGMPQSGGLLCLITDMSHEKETIHACLQH